MPCYEEGGPACVNTEAVTNPLEDGLMSEDYTAPDGTLLQQGVPLFERPYMLSWYERQRYFVTAERPWWKFWAKPHKLQASRWVRQSRAIGQDLAKYLLEPGGLDRAWRLIFSMCACDADAIWGIHLECAKQTEMGAFHTNYVRTTTNPALDL